MSSYPSDSLAWAHPVVRDWFIQKFASATEPQQQAWPSILAGQTTLVSAPTGSGKTFTAFLVCIDRLVRQALTAELKAGVEVIYISPLKALSNDIQKNLTEPLAEISALAKKRGLQMDEIRIGLRTGDTLMRDRRAMLKKPPHILVTTPESFYILITAEKTRALLSQVRTVIVDEIHVMVNDKRGAHLALSLERLEAITAHQLLRIGLSATQKPIEVVARFLAGTYRPLPVIINIGYGRDFDLAVEVPITALGAIASNELWDELYDRIANLAQEHRSTLIFVNTRRLAERVAHHLSERLGENWVAAHHGSLSRPIRLAVETKLKNGELKALVATASLELGIDIGSIDLVCQIGSPRAITVALQRIGRAGHWRGAISKGRIFATTRDELVECAALMHAIRENELDQLLIPQQPIDILVQQIVASCATQEWDEEDLFALVTSAYPYSHLTREKFDSLMEMLAEGIVGARGRYAAYLHRDRVNNKVRARRGSRIIAITCGGAIPDNGLFNVIVEPEGILVGTLDEDFAIESARGDIILLGSASWRIKRIESVSARVIVEDAFAAPPSVPFWRGEAPARTFELSSQIAKLRQNLSESLLNTAAVDFNPQSPEIIAALDWLKEHCQLCFSGAQQLLMYLLNGRAVLGAVPTQCTVIAERFFDESGGMQLIIHAPFGARINKAWGLALRKRFCRSFNFELQAAATDDGINIALAEQHSFPLADVFHFLHPNSIQKVLTQAVLQSPLFTTRWRWSATRALALLRFQQGKKVPPNIQRMRSEDLLAAVFPDAVACQDNLAGREIELPDHPLVNEAIKDALTQALDLEGLMDVLQKIQNQEIKCLAVDTAFPSPFAHEILNANPYAFLDDAPLEERRARAVEMRQVLPESLLLAVGRLDGLAINEVQQQVWPDIRNADELHDSLLTFIALPEKFSLHAQQQVLPIWKVYFESLMNQGRAGSAVYQGATFWFAVEKAKTFLAIYPQAKLQQPLLDIEKNTPSHPEALLSMIRGWMLHLGPTTGQELTSLLGLNSLEVEQALLKLEASGFQLRGQFKSLEVEPIEWCERRLLARIHRLTVAKLRQAIEPVSAIQFVAWLLKWQHFASGTQLKGPAGLLEVIRQLQGFELPANAWERQILAKRLSDYDTGMLDRLCLSGAVGWGRLSLHSALEDTTQNTRRIIPNSIIPITLFIREEAHWMPARELLSKEKMSILSNVARSIYEYLHQKGASFFADIERGSGRLKAEVESGLWELIAAGMVTADSFDNLRALIDSHRRLNKRKRSSIFSHFNSGRWSLLPVIEMHDRAKYVESVCWMLLHRYGVVFRDLLARESIILRWHELLVEFRRLESRGEIRAGRFVSGFVGEQFAVPVAVESLRAMRNLTNEFHEMDVSAVDPLNLMGIVLPGKRVAAISGKMANINLMTGSSSAGKDETISI